ncbi:MAG TPA: BlaI/MecI/CopY family transcriptional regulator [archaeon]|nr:BlaI/MecI/CopY family transcriptional regulator [archaeon]
MTDRDLFKNVLDSKEQVNNLNEKFNDLTLDIQEIMNLSSNPAFLSLLLFKLTEERKRTNDLLDRLNKKYDSLVEMMQKKGFHGMHQHVSDGSKVNILSEQDQQIMNLVQNKGAVSALEVQSALGYKGKNAASQRLNKLYREGYLKKAQSGKKVLYLPPT